jgi:hypothetical protein
MGWPRNGWVTKHGTTTAISRKGRKAHPQKTAAWLEDSASRIPFVVFPRCVGESILCGVRSTGLPALAESSAPRSIHDQVRSLFFRYLPSHQQRTISLAAAGSQSIPLGHDPGREVALRTKPGSDRVAAANLTAGLCGMSSTAR